MPFEPFTPLYAGLEALMMDNRLKMVSIVEHVNFPGNHGFSAREIRRNTATTYAFLVGTYIQHKVRLELRMSTFCVSIRQPLRTDRCF